ncbi:MAG: PD40 domain-containing protein, partial [Phycisphaeraceae bacterium]|nr:PD40 domain-containing protein [Phycisphaeraceae bacterium]
PEQARGRPLDKRTDVWSFGCVLFESLVGTPPFRADTISDTIALILRSEPEWNELPLEVPVRVREVLRKCLQKDPKRRLRDLGDARIELHDAYGAMSGAMPDAAEEFHTRVSAAAPAPTWLSQSPWIVAAFAVALAATLLAIVIKGRGSDGSVVPAATAPARFVLAPPPGASFDAADGAGAAAISPDGSQLVYRARDESGARLYLRRLDTLEAEPIPGTDDGRMPFFAPDGSSLGFFTPGRLRRVGLTGGQRFVQDVAAVPDEAAGGAWTADDTIVFASVGSSASGLFRVGSEGGTPTRLTTADRSQSESAHVWPHVLPDGRTIVFTAASMDGPESAAIMALRLDGKHEPAVVVKGYSAARYGGGYLVCVRGSSLYAVRFDADRLVTTGSPVRVVERILASPDRHSGEFVLSSVGTLAYIPGTIAQSANTLVLLSRDRSVPPVDLLTSASVQASPRFDPRDSKRVFYVSGDDGGIWRHTRGESDATAVFAGAGLVGRPTSLVFRPDGSSLAVSLNRANNWSVSVVSPDGAAAPRDEYSSDRPLIVSSWRPELGAELAAVDVSPATGRDAVRIASGAKSSIVSTSADEHSPAFSPDGRWIAYVSNRDGGNRVYLGAYPDTGMALDVSQGHGEEPIWDRSTWTESGGEILFRDRDTIKRVHVLIDGGRPRVSSPDVVVRGRFRMGNDGVPAWDLSADGSSIVVISEGRIEARAETMHIVLGFTREIERLFPPN